MIVANANATLTGIDAADWDTLVRDDDPFTSYAYMRALEDTGQAGPQTRWVPRHVAAHDGERLVGVLPLYEKDDSRGEFVFDFAWADAYQRAIGPYYPKLVTAVPYSPVGGRRLLIAADVDRHAVAAALIRAALDEMENRQASSWHVQFCHEDDVSWLSEAGFLPRRDCQFHWFNQDYRDFDHYLESFRSSRRKKTRRERRRVREAGVTFSTRHGHELSADDWQSFYEFYASSFYVRGRPPYFTPEFFPALGERLGNRIMIKTAQRDGEDIAAAFFLRNATRLYGRYWGCKGFVDALHFETCYYQGIDYCLTHGLRHFDPGTQGEHKIARGFQAHPSYSMHIFREERFHAAVDDYLSREARSVDAYMEAVDQHLPFRDGESP